MVALMVPLARLRHLVIAWRRAAAQAERARWAGEDAPPSSSRERAALGTGEARELLATLVEAGAIEPADERAFLTHLADAAREELAARRRAGSAPRVDERLVIDGETRSLLELVSDEARWPARLGPLGAAIEARARAAAEVSGEADLLASGILARATRPEAASVDVEGWLEATDDAAREAYARASHALGLRARGRGTSSSPTTPLAVLRASSLDRLLRERDRVPLLARALGPIGFDAMVGARLGLARHDELRVGARILLLDPPRRVLLGLSRLDLGLASSLATIEGLGRGLAFARSSPALGAEHRFAPFASCPPLIGALTTLFMTSPTFLRASLGLEASEARTLRAVASYLVLAGARLTLARLALRGQAPGDEALDALGARALGAEPFPGARSSLLSFDPTPHLARLARAATLAPTLYLALRDRYDEDFFRNPRTAAVIDGAAARGASLGAEAWIEELGGESEPAPSARVASAFYRERLADRAVA